MNDRVREKGKLFLTMQKLINIEGMMGFDYHHFPAITATIDSGKNH